jgi:predicted DNA-binding transcriptional regulator AlpA
MKSYSLDQWLALHSLSRPFWYKLVDRGEAPRAFRIGRCVRISEEALAFGEDRMPVSPTQAA